MVGLAEEWDYVASFYIVNDALAPEVWTGLESTIAALLDTNPGAVLGGVSTPPVPGLAVKLLGPNGSGSLGDDGGLMGSRSRSCLEAPAYLITEILSRQSFPVLFSD